MGIHLSYKEKSVVQFHYPLLDIVKNMFNYLQFVPTGTSYMGR